MVERSVPESTSISIATILTISVGSNALRNIITFVVGLPKLGSAIRKIIFYKSIPLPLWDVHCGIPLLDPP